MDEFSDFGEFSNPMGDYVDPFGIGQQDMSPMIGFNDPYEAEMAMMKYRGPMDNYYFNMDEDLMLKLGFTEEELSILNAVVDYYGTVTTQKLTTPPFVIPNHTMVQRIIYAYNICMGKKTIDTTDPYSLAQHFKKLAQISMSYNPNISFNCMQLIERDITVIPRVAVVAGLPQGNFYSLNSNLYDKMEATYRVEQIAKEWVTIYCERPLRVGVQDRLNNSYNNREWGIPGILKVEEIGNFAENKPWKIKIHKSHCRLCNRFMIIISTRKILPENLEHHGCYQLITSTGQMVYVYAKTTSVDSYGNPRDTVPKPTKDTIVFDYGFYRAELKPKLERAVSILQSKFDIVYAMPMDGEVQYSEISQYSGMENITRTEDNENNEEYDDYNSYENTLIDDTFVIQSEDDNFD